MKIQDNIYTSYRHNIEEYKGRNDPEAIKTVAKEMEALFAYELIKAMRTTTNTTSNDSLGKDVYMSMFDMELARLFAERGLGLRDILFKELNRGVQNTEHGANGEDQRNSKLNNHDSRRSSLPVDGIISSNFGIRKHPIYGIDSFHHGTDIAAPDGTPIYPFRNGKVIFSGEQTGFGNVVIVDHGNGFTSKYAHNKINLVKEGDSVDTNSVIALVGNTGRSTGSHLHFEVRYKDDSINPILALSTDDADTKLQRHIGTKRLSALADSS
ncbi:MAG: peptidase family M23/M37 domain protein [bacterium]|nr:MAG: peptidase family M23/M37 domain protein [bacterium]